MLTVYDIHITAEMFQHTHLIHHPVSAHGIACVLSTYRLPLAYNWAPPKIANQSMIWI